MGGEGSMMHAIKSLKANRDLLKKRKKKTKEDVYGIANTTKLYFKESTSEDVLRVRQKMVKYNRRLKIMGFWAGILTFLIVTIITLFIVI